VFSVGRAVRVSIPSPDIGESGARARLAFRISVEAAHRSVATSCRKVHHMQRFASIAIACHSFLYLFCPSSSASHVRASIGISSFTRGLCNELSRHKTDVDPFARYEYRV
jgi:hypothetical protein